MKNILLSVDFSKNAQKVALHTAEMAQLAKARLILCHVYHADAAKEGLPHAGTYNERWVQTRLDRLARTLHEATGVSVTRLVKPASDGDDALAVAKAVKAGIAVICDQASQKLNAASFIRGEGLTALTVPISSQFDLQAFRAELAAQLQLHGYAPPLLVPV